jgi:hypothetical protein
MTGANIPGGTPIGDDHGYFKEQFEALKRSLPDRITAEDPPPPATRGVCNLGEKQSYSWPGSGSIVDVSITDWETSQTEKFKATLINQPSDGVIAEEPVPAPPPKPYNDAVNDVHRYLKEIVDRAPPEQMDGSVKEGVREDLDRAIKRREDQKSWPGALT